MKNRIFAALLISALTLSSAFALSGGIDAKAAENQDSNNYSYSSEINEELSLEGSSVDKTVIFLDDYVKAYAEASGGTGDYTYSYYFKKSTDSDYTIVSENSGGSTEEISFSSAGYYKVKITAEDSEGNTAEKEFDITVKEDTGSKLSNKSQISAKTVKVGQTIKVSTIAEGGTAPYRYRFSYKTETGEWLTVNSYSEKNTADYKFTKAGWYKIIIGVRDADDNYSETLYDVAVTSETNKELKASSTISNTTVNLGNSIGVNASASGGSQAYRYRFSYKDSDGNWITVRDYSQKNYADFKFPKGGYYTIIVGVRDGSNRYAENLYRVTVKNDTQKTLKAASTISSSSIFVNTDLKVTANASGGVEPYRYKFSYKDSTGKWVTVQDYNSKRTATMNFSESGIYTIIVGVRDINNNYSENLYKVTVKKNTGKTFTNSSTVSSSSIKEGETLTLKANASGGTEPYQYKYLYQNPNNNNWVTIKDYSTNKSASVKFNSNGIYNVKIVVKDAMGRVSEKTISVDVVSKTATRTIASTSLMGSAKWATRTLNNIPSGSNVYLIGKSGNWFKVNYNGTNGWIYNLALGSYKNYTEVTTSTLPVVADDIIFNRGKSVQSLYKYVTSTNYKNMNKDSLENMCVYLIKYRRGACYQRAAMLYYLLNRAGYDVVRVDDGIDDYTGGGPHNWCIIKTADGWRHIDPTHVIGLPTFYLVKDSAIAPYFSWDRNKYPKCV